MISLPSRFAGLEIPPDDPFQKDKLGYRKYAEVLTGMVQMYQETGCVIAINGKWGIGKTTFVKMWQADLSKQQISTIYFNAWETDYFSDPLVAILGELKEISKDDASFRDVCSKLGKVLLGTGVAAAKGLLKKTTGIDSDVVSAAVDEAKNIFQSELDDYAKQKGSLEEFKKALSEYVADQYSSPVVFIIDELDRCNPHYAVKVLETVKHLFDIQNIIFVLAIDKTQLELSIKGFYGNSDIDAASYLRRFIDIEFRLPQPDLQTFATIILGHYDFASHYDMRNQDLNDFHSIVCVLGNLYQMDLRTFDKTLSHIRLAFEQLGNEKVLEDPVTLLCFLRVAHPQLFEDIALRKYSVQEFLTACEKEWASILDHSQKHGSDRDAHTMLYAIVPLLMLYNTEQGVEKETCFNNSEIPLDCLYIDKDDLKTACGWAHQHINTSPGLEHVLKFVNLLQSFS